MKLTEMTNDQLVNIILRKDDVETRLRKEIATLQQENKRLVKVKRYRVLAIGLIIAVVCLAFIGFSSCNTNKQHSKGQIVTTVSSDSCQAKGEERLTTQDLGFEPMFDTISFFGKPLVMDDSTHIMRQISVIVESDTMLSIDGWVLTVGKVGFGIAINIHSGYLRLLSSTQVDDPKIKEVLEYLNSIYGTPYENDPDDYWWRDRADDIILGWIVRMRPFRSEEGGTVLFFRN